MKIVKMKTGPQGIEHPTDSLENSNVAGAGGAKSGALGAQKPAPDSVATWLDGCPVNLPDAIRAGIVAMIRATVGPS